MSRIEFPVDRSQVWSANEILADIRRMRLFAFSIGVSLLGCAALLTVFRHPSAYIGAVLLCVAAAVALWIALWNPRRLWSAGRLYRENDVAPAVIAEVQPAHVTLLALLNVAKDGHPAQYALVATRVWEVPGHALKVGERVPSVAVSLDRSSNLASDTWQAVSPMPIAWATRDDSVIAAAQEMIAPAEWEVLFARIDSTVQIAATVNHRVMLAPAELPAHLR